MLTGITTPIPMANVFLSERVIEIIVVWIPVFPDVRSHIMNFSFISLVLMRLAWEQSRPGVVVRLN